MDTHAPFAQFLKEECRTVAKSSTASTAFNPIPQSAKSKLSPFTREFIGNIDNKMIDENPMVKNRMAASLMEKQNRANYALEQLFLQQQESIMAFTLPQPNMPVFVGDPSEYYTFVHSFQHQVEAKAINPSARLCYLIQYTSEQVQE